MKTKVWIVAIAIIMGFLSVPVTAFAISPQQLQEMMGRGGAGYNYRYKGT